MYDGDQQINEPFEKGLSSMLHKDSFRRGREKKDQGFEFVTS